MLASPATHLAELVKERSGSFRELSSLLDELVDKLKGLRTLVMGQVTAYNRPFNNLSTHCNEPRRVYNSRRSRGVLNCSIP